MDNPLKKFLNFKNFNFFKKKSDSVVAVDFGSSSAKVVQLRKDKGRILLETYAELATGPYAEQAIGQASVLSTEKMVELLNDLFKEANVTAKTVCFSIPLRSSLLVSLSLPNLGRAEIEKVIPIEARKYIPVPISEVFLDWWMVPGGLPGDLPPGEETGTSTGKKAETVEVLVAAVHKDTIQQYRDVASKLGLVANLFEIETFSSIRSAVNMDMKAKALVDLGASSTKIAIVDYGVVRQSHTISKGAQDLTVDISRSLGISFVKAEEIKRRVGLIPTVGEDDLQKVVSPIIDYIFNEISVVISDYQKKHSRVVDKIVLIGGGSMLKGLIDVARNSVDAPIVIGKPFDRVEVPAFLQDILIEEGPSFATGIGVAMRALQEM